MNNIFIIIGGSNSGKSSVIRSLTQIVAKKERKKRIFLENKNDLICVYIKRASFQEDKEIRFCEFKKVISKLKKYIHKCEKEAKKDSIPRFVILITFSVRLKKEKVGEDCVLKPLKYLKKLSNYKITTICLKRAISRLGKVNKFLDDIKASEYLISKETGKNRQDKNGIILKKIIINASKIKIEAGEYCINE